MSKCCSRIHGYHVYKQGWLTLVGEVLQYEWEARNRVDPHMVVVVNDGLIGHVTRISLETLRFHFRETAVICNIRKIYILRNIYSK